MGWKSFFSKKEKEDLDQGLEKTKKSFFSKIASSVAGKSKIDDEVWFFIRGEEGAKNILSNFRTAYFLNFILC